MGGRIALHAALALADRVERLVLVGASPGIADAAERAARRAADEALADADRGDRRRGLRPRVGRAAAVRRPAASASRAAAHADRLRNTPAGLAAALRGLGTGAMEPLWDRLPALAIPVTLAVGERDEKFRAIAERMAALLPTRGVEVVPDAGHAAQLEQPAAVAALLEASARRAVVGSVNTASTQKLKFRSARRCRRRRCRRRRGS